ncbi:hypothetical protein BDW42DRAFT_174375 [Aspergillus taichungensis]|uniref:Uncharacterized protein n=1 Tax=Aspergillus taichungensis TaxID=482145 RepID=A0A2J5HNC4_9EURO|nr:hypothetical protein BDW42DRAFT_174375 [Aspergillus taichungensis]
MGACVDTAGHLYSSLCFLHIGIRLQGWLSLKFLRAHFFSHSPLLHLSSIKLTCSITMPITMPAPLLRKRERCCGRVMKSRPSETNRKGIGTGGTVTVRSAKGLLRTIGWA